MLIAERALMHRKMCQDCILLKLDIALPEVYIICSFISLVIEFDQNLIS